MTYGEISFNGAEILWITAILILFLFQMLFVCTCGGTSDKNATIEGDKAIDVEKGEGEEGENAEPKNDNIHLQPQTFADKQQSYADVQDYATLQENQGMNPTIAGQQVTTKNQVPAPGETMPFNIIGDTQRRQVEGQAAAQPAGSLLPPPESPAPREPPQPAYSPTLPPRISAVTPRKRPVTMAKPTVKPREETMPFKIVNTQAIKQADKEKKPDLFVGRRDYGTLMAMGIPEKAMVASHRAPVKPDKPKEERGPVKPKEDKDKYQKKEEWYHHEYKKDKGKEKKKDRGEEKKKDRAEENKKGKGEERQHDKGYRRKKTSDKDKPKDKNGHRRKDEHHEERVEKPRKRKRRRRQIAKT